MNFTVKRTTLINCLKLLSPGKVEEGSQLRMVAQGNRLTMTLADETEGSIEATVTEEGACFFRHHKLLPLLRKFTGAKTLEFQVGPEEMKIGNMKISRGFWEISLFKNPLTAPDRAINKPKKGPPPIKLAPASKTKDESPPTQPEAKTIAPLDAFPTIAKLASEVGSKWENYTTAYKETIKAEQTLTAALSDEFGPRFLDADSSFVLFGSFARYEMSPGSDCDWTLLINGVVNNSHADVARKIRRAIKKAQDEGKGLKAPSVAGPFGNFAISHDLVHKVGGKADANDNLTCRMLMLLESRALTLSKVDSSDQVWTAVLRSISERYFDEDHFSPDKPRKVPRFMLNDFTRYWRTIGVDYAAKFQERDGQGWALRNAKLRLSRKLIFAAGLAFCFSCHLDPPRHTHTDLFGEVIDNSSVPFIAAAMAFARKPPLEYLAAFIDTFIANDSKRKVVVGRVFGSYNEWLSLLRDPDARQELANCDHVKADSSKAFQRVRDISREFAKGLELLFFDRDRDLEGDQIARLSTEYVAF